jgi:uncharacterized protein (DUF433 family)
MHGHLSLGSQHALTRPTPHLGQFSPGGTGRAAAEFVDLAAKACHQRMVNTTFITTNHHILGGTPVFAGTRVPVRILFEYIETGETLAEFFAEFPSVSRELAQGVLQEAKQAVVHPHSA